ncbi:hypothetical protein QNA08_12370 [Chelatococcus sp. SYSU_G07232]|uniref:PhiE125 gp8 family phage protein n=1 Tax=Chelatococcus albus TaxID=3047466 RepID=A0ABT7AI21_9HYPH|nr:hypothetical protein [Chelatococcus sp. SYSU_G07232]MDJ1159031.1 hypothetical protein [Chelatococcus sp. SYSU_G07232]
MTPILVSGPAVEPVSLAAMKAHLRLDTGEEDDLVTSLVTAARLMVEAASGRLLVAQTWRLVLDVWPTEGVLRVPLTPFAGLLAARLAARDGGAPEPLPLAAFATDTRAEPGRIALVAPVPPPRLARGGIELDVAAGYGADPAAVPMPLRQAVTELAAHWFEHRGDGEAAAEAALPPGVRVLLAPFRRMRL